MKTFDDIDLKTSSVGASHIDKTCVMAIKKNSLGHFCCKTKMDVARVVLSCVELQCNTQDGNVESFCLMSDQLLRLDCCQVKNGFLRIHSF